MAVRVLLPLILLGSLLADAGSSEGGSEQPLDERWMAAMKSGGWVTAFLDVSARNILGYDLIVVKAGGVERIVYRAEPRDFQMAVPVVSRDGTQVAFLKVEEVAGEFRERVYAVNPDGSDIRELVELLPAHVPIARGAYIGTSPLAWSHDRRKLAIVGVAKGTEPARPLQRWETRPLSLLEHDVSTGRLTVLRPIVVQKDRWLGPRITTQAWAPDNRRLVFLSDEGRITILDTTTGATTDLGVGSDPSWSPDGQFIAITSRTEAGARRYPDHVLISAAPPHERSLLLSNDRSWLPFRVPWYAGPALWFPDGRHLVVWGVLNEQALPYVLDRATRQLEKLPPRYWGSSWGGKP